jgi:hypothetical protein
MTAASSGVSKEKRMINKEDPKEGSNGLLPVGGRAPRLATKQNRKKLAARLPGRNCADLMSLPRVAQLPLDVFAVKQVTEDELVLG